MADERETINRQIYEVNRLTVENGKTSDPAAILVPIANQHDAREAAHLVDRLHLGGVDVYRADAAFEADGIPYGAGTFVIPMTQVFARYAKDMLEKQTYPEVRRAPNEPPEPPYDVTAWSLGMLLDVNTVFVKKPLPAGLKMTAVTDLPGMPGSVTGSGPRFTFGYDGPDTAAAMNRLLKAGAHLAFDMEPAAPAARASSESSSGAARASGGEAPRAVIDVTGVSRTEIEQVAKDYGLAVRTAAPSTQHPAPSTQHPEIPFKAPRIGMYQPWTGGNMDEGWTRWVLEQYGFNNTPIHNADIKAGKLRERFDAIILADQSPRDILDGFDAPAIRPEYRGGIGHDGLASLKRFLADGGTLITMGSACDLAIDELPIPVKDIKKGLTRDQHFAPGAILRLEVDTTNPIGYGVAGDTYGFYINSPFFGLTDGFASQKVSVVARYPNTNIVASGWLKGEEYMAGTAAVVSIDMNPGHVVLFGLRPQHRAQTHATFPLLFNALYLAAR